MTSHIFSGQRKSIFISPMSGEVKRGWGGRKGDWTGFGFLPLRTISNFTYEMVETVGKNRREAVLGSAGQDVRCFRPGQSYHLAPFH